MQQKTFIVPHDFTIVADIALQHAIAAAKPLNAIVQLLHVVSKENQIQDALTQLHNVIEKFVAEGVNLQPVNLHGNAWRSRLATHHRKSRTKSGNKLPSTFYHCPRKIRESYGL
jgi:hypothetical protein